MAIYLRGCFEQIVHECDLTLNTWLIVMDVATFDGADHVDD